MNLSLRPKIPSFALTYLKYASIPRATLPAIAASPLRGTLEPILISVDVTPGVASGRAPAAVAVNTATATETRNALTPTYDLLYNRLVIGPKRRRSNPPTPVGSTIMTMIRTAPKITLDIPSRFGSRLTAGRWLSQRVTSAARNFST